MRVAQQVSTLASLPPVFVAVVIALNVVPPTLPLAIGAAALLIILDVLGWRVTSSLFNRESLITGTR